MKNIMLIKENTARTLLTNLTKKNIWSIEIFFSRLQQEGKYLLMSHLNRSNINYLREISVPAYRAHHPYITWFVVALLTCSWLGFCVCTVAVVNWKTSTIISSLNRSFLSSSTRNSNGNWICQRMPKLTIHYLHLNTFTTTIRSITTLPFFLSFSFL